MWHVLWKLTLAQSQTHRVATHSLRRPKIGLHPAYIFLPLCILFFLSKIIIIPHCLSEMWCFCWDWGEREIKKKSVEINGKNNENRAWRRSGKPMWNTHDFDLNKDMRLHEEERANRFRRGSLDIQRQNQSLNADLWLKMCVSRVARVTISYK